VLGAASDARSLIVGALLVILAVWSSSLEHGSEPSRRDADAFPRRGDLQAGLPAGFGLAVAVDAARFFSASFTA
jgi:hypothetical protein